MYRKYPANSYIICMSCTLSSIYLYNVFPLCSQYCKAFWLNLSHGCYVNRITFEWGPLYMTSAKWRYRVIRNSPSHIVHHRASAVNHHPMQRISYLANDIFRFDLSETAVCVIWRLCHYAARHYVQQSRKHSKTLPTYLVVSYHNKSNGTWCLPVSPISESFFLHHI